MKYNNFLIALALCAIQAPMHSAQINNPTTNINRKELEQALADSQQKLTDLEKIMDEKRDATINQTLSKLASIKHQNDSIQQNYCQQLIEAAIATGEQHYKIDTINNQLLSTKETNPTSTVGKNSSNKITSTARAIIAKGFELFGLRQKHTMEEKNKAQVIIAQLEEQKQKLIKEYQEKTNIMDSHLSIHNLYNDLHNKEDARQRNKYAHDMTKFDKTIREQQIITGDAILPYLWNTD